LGLTFTVERTQLVGAKKTGHSNRKNSSCAGGGNFKKKFVDLKKRWEGPDTGRPIHTEKRPKKSGTHYKIKVPEKGWTATSSKRGRKPGRRNG